uniref:FAR1 domain-containing protein n=1 Tax=Rhizophagus irregularis (strain DAOM 181602 / DAOM 197198 / MUCL 43194) TaxID=747089 RepID=U9UBB8_RHIID
MEFNAFCSDYHNNNYETSAFISTYSEPFNDNFTNINLSLYSEPFNINFLPSSLELSEPPFVSPVLPFVSPVEPLLTSDDNFTDIETSLPLEPSFGNSNYQYNLAVGDSFDDWLLVDTFMHQYCLERGFGYQIFRNDKDPNDSTIIRCKSFHCSLSGNYEPQKIMD